MYKELCLALFVCLACVALTESYDACVRNGVNGCSIPLGLPFPYKSRFTKACNRHDVCYFCGTTNHIKRSSCDYYFYKNMRRTCQWWNARCHKYAVLYYLAVRTAGSKFWAGSESWCTESWVRGCMK